MAMGAYAFYRTSVKHGYHHRQPMYRIQHNCALVFVSTNLFCVDVPVSCGCMTKTPGSLLSSTPVVSWGVSGHLKQTNEPCKVTIDFF